MRLREVFQLTHSFSEKAVCRKKSCKISLRRVSSHRKNLDFYTGSFLLALCKARSRHKVRVVKSECAGVTLMRAGGWRAQEQPEELRGLVGCRPPLEGRCSSVPSKEPQGEGWA